jgi:rod shape-determining protein MreD
MRGEYVNDMMLIILWLIQDFLTVFAGGGMQIPALFMLGLVYKLLIDEGSEDSLWAIWSAFAGGILWDLRWVGIPGFFTLGYVIVVLIVIQVWGMIPPQGRISGTGILVFTLLEVSQLLPPMLPVMILGSLGGANGLGVLLMRQVYSFPAILLCMYLYFQHVRNNKV